MFFPESGFWLYSNRASEFGVRDLGYYVGYAICERYYDKAVNKKQAVKDMIELDYNDNAALMAFVDRSGYFDQPVATLYQEYETGRPTVTQVDVLSKNDTLVDPKTNKITVTFSSPMDTGARGFEFGPLGEMNGLRVKQFTGFSGDGKSMTFEVSLDPGRHYQLLLTSRFRDTGGKPLKPYLIEFDTAKL